MPGETPEADADLSEVLSPQHRHFLLTRGYTATSRVGLGSQGVILRAFISAPTSRPSSGTTTDLVEGGGGGGAAPAPFEAVVMPPGGEVGLKEAPKGQRGERAVKVIPKAPLSAVSHECVQREIRVLSKVKHPHIVSLVEAFEDVDNYYVIFELLNGGDLFSKVAEGPLDEFEVVVILEQLLSAMAYLHAHGFAHRDIKLENVMISHTSPYSDSADDAAEMMLPVVKFIDFGVCNEREPGGPRTSSLYCGTSVYLPPEIVAQRAYVPEEADIYELGVLVYTMLQGRYPFPMQERDALFNAIINTPPSFDGLEWEGISPELINLLDRMLAKKGRDRVTAKDALDDTQALLVKWLKDWNVRDHKKPNIQRKVTAALFRPMKLFTKTNVHDVPRHNGSNNNSMRSNRASSNANALEKAHPSLRRSANWAKNQPTSVVGKNHPARSIGQSQMQAEAGGMARLLKFGMRKKNTENGRHDFGEIRDLDDGDPPGVAAAAATATAAAAGGAPPKKVAPARQSKLGKKWKMFGR